MGRVTGQLKLRGASLVAWLGTPCSGQALSRPVCLHKPDPVASLTEHLLTLSAAYRTAVPAQDATVLNMPAFSSSAGGGVPLASAPLPAMFVLQHDG